MNERRIQLIDSCGAVIATGQVTERDGLFVGAIESNSLPNEMATLFRDFEAAVNDQLFSHADDLEDSIATLALRVRFDDGSQFPITNAQLSVGELSFRTTAFAPVIPPSADFVAERNELRPL